MTPDELRALADALEPMAKAPRFEDFDVPAFCAWVRAQADAQPVAAMPAKWTERHTSAQAWIEDADQAHDLRLYVSGLMESHDQRITYAQEIARRLNAAPAAPQAEPIDPHMIVADDRFPDAQAEPKRQLVSEATALIEWPESAKWKNRAALEGVERSCMAEPKREPLTDERIASVCLSYRHDFGLLSGDEQAGLMLEARAWERAFRKEWQR